MDLAEIKKWAEGIQPDSVTVEISIKDFKEMVRYMEILQSSLTLSRAEGRREGMEAAAKIAESAVWVQSFMADIAAGKIPIAHEHIAAAIREAAQGKEGE